MALVLTMVEGEDLYIEGTQVVLEKVRGSQDFDLRIKDSGFVVSVSSHCWTHLMSGVLVQASLGFNIFSRKVRLMLDAPGKLILKGVKCEVCHGDKQIRTTSRCENCGGHGCPMCRYKGQVENVGVCPECEGRGSMQKEKQLS